VNQLPAETSRLAALLVGFIAHYAPSSRLAIQAPQRESDSLILARALTRPVDVALLGRAHNEPHHRTHVLEIAAGSRGMAWRPCGVLVALLPVMHRDRPASHAFETSPSLLPSTVHDSRPRCAVHQLLVGPSGACSRCAREDASALDRRVLRIIAFAGVCVLLLGVVVRIGVGARDAIADAMAASRTSAASAAATASDGRLVIYTSTWCPYCTKAKAWLAARDIAYEERNIDDGAALREMHSLGASGVPTFAMNGQLIQKGFDPSGRAILKALEERDRAGDRDGLDPAQR